MEHEVKKINAHGDVEQSGINTCVYPPEENKQGLPQYDKASVPSSVTLSPVAEHSTSSLVLPISTDDMSNWKSFFSDKLENNNLQLSKNQVSEHGQLEAILQALVEHGQDILPLLSVLKEKAECNEYLASILKILQDRLNLGVNVVCSLSPREMEVLEFAATGASNSQIAADLHLQTVTVTKTLTRAYRKLDAKNRAEAVHKWMLLRGASR